LENFSLNAMPYARFEGQASIEEPEDIKSSYMIFDIQNVFASPSKSEKLIRQLGDKDFSLPSQVINLEYILARGRFKGRMDDFHADASFNTKAGRVTTDIKVKKQVNSGKLAYSGNISSKNFDLGHVMENDVFDYLDFSVNIEGVGTDKYAEAELNAKIDSVMLNNRKYDDIKLRGNYAGQQFDGLVNISTERFKLMANGKADFSGDIPSYIASVEIPLIDFKKMGVISPETEGNPVASTSMLVQLEGNNMNNIDGWIAARESQWRNEDQHVTMDEFSLHINGREGNKQSIELMSDFIDVQVDGRFDYETVASDMKYILSSELPELAGGEEFKAEEYRNNLDTGHYVNLQVNLKNTEELTDAFMPQLQIADSSRIDVLLSVDKQRMNIDGNIDYVNAGMLKIQDIHLSEDKTSRLGFDITSNRIQINDTIGIDNFAIHTKTYRDSLGFKIEWNDDTPKNINIGDISGMIDLAELPKIAISMNESSFRANDTVWNISDNSFASFDTNRIAVKDFRLGNQYQWMKLDGAISDDSSDEMMVQFNSLDISNIDPITQSKKMDFDGMITGELKMSNLYSENPTITSDIRIDSIGFNHEHLGDAIIRSGWVDSLDALSANVEIKYQGNIGVSYPLKLEGFFYPFADKDNFDFTMALQNFKLQTIAGYLSSFTSYFRGLASGEVQLKGSLDDPKLSGEVRLMRTVLKIDYLNTTYSVSDSVRFNNNEIVFDQVSINDNNSEATRGNQAILDGKINHNNFNEIELDLSIDADNFTVLNTSYSEDEMYYGTAIATGKVDIYGPTHDISIDVAAKTEKGSKLFIPLTNSSEASQSDFITFINKKDTAKNISFEQERKENVKGLSINVNLEATSDAEVQIIFDETVGDIIKARGAGQMEFNVDTRGDFSMYGNYTIEEGDYLFTLENLINKRFNLKEGGTISWAGDPLDANLNLDAVYKTEARLYDLIGYLDSSEVYKKRRPVNCIIHLDGDLSSPEITPDITLPNSDEMTRQLVRSVLYVNANQVNQQEMNRQFLGLLVLNSFFPPANIAGETGGGMSDYMGLGSTSSTELLSNQLSNWLSQISNDFNVGVNYRSGDEISSEQLEVALSTQLFDDRVSISTNVGVGGENPAEQQNLNEDETTNIVGDVNVEYKINDKIKLRAFNQHNRTSYLEESGPYTQGIGVFYRKEFDKFIDLFRSQKQEDETEQKEKRPENPTSEPDQQDTESQDNGEAIKPKDLDE
ncbi:MAG: translocation/assembly module TamB domain-containing protein, partial [Bacteroidales bacterium]